MLFEEIKAIAKELETYEALLKEVPTDKKESFACTLARKRLQFEEACKEYFLGSERINQEDQFYFEFLE